MLATMTNADDLIGTTESMEILGITSRDSFIRMVARGELTAKHKMPGPNGAYVFGRGDVERLAETRAEAKSA